MHQAPAVGASAAAIQFMWHFLLLPWLSACGLLRVAFLALVVLDCLYVLCAIAMPAAVTQLTAMALMFLGPCLWSKPWSEAALDQLRAGLLGRS